MIFRLTDVADDGCLSREEILKMFGRIEKNFARESVTMECGSSTLINEIATRKALRKYHWALQKVGGAKISGENKDGEDGLITYEGNTEKQKWEN